MRSCQRPTECDFSRYRHGCDPPKQIQSDCSSPQTSHLDNLPDPIDSVAAISLAFRFSISQKKQTTSSGVYYFL
jgi:hypothetical protein